MNSLYKFDNGKNEKAYTIIREKTKEAPKSKVDIHCEINVIEADEQSARMKARRRWSDGTIIDGDEQGLPQEYKLVSIQQLGKDWN
jgi:hypothetical protein